MQFGANESASNSPSQLGGFPGGCQRCSPTGGAANGMPLKTLTESLSPVVVPINFPCGVSRTTASAITVLDKHNAIAAMVFFIFLSPALFYCDFLS
jgi:hypothetical protein